MNISNLTEISSDYNNLIREYAEYASSRGIPSYTIDEDIESIVEGSIFNHNKFSENVFNFIKISQNTSSSPTSPKPAAPAPPAYTGFGSTNWDPNANPTTKKPAAPAAETQGKKPEAKREGDRMNMCDYTDEDEKLSFTEKLIKFTGCALLEVQGDNSDRERIQKLLLNYANNIISLHDLVSPPENRAIFNIYNNRRNKPNCRYLFTLLDSSRQHMTRIKGESQAERDREASESRELAYINKERARKGLAPFGSMEEVRAFREKEKADTANLEERMIECIADGDLDALMALNPTYDQFNKLIYKIIDGAPNSDNGKFYDEDHFKEGVEEYLRSRYGIYRQRNESVFENLFNKILIYDERSVGIRQRNREKRDQGSSSTHQRQMGNLGRQREIAEARRRLEESRKRRR